MSKSAPKKSDRQKQNEYEYPWKITLNKLQLIILRTVGLIIAPCALFWAFGIRECGKNIGWGVLVYSISLVAIAISFTYGKKSWPALLIPLGVILGGLYLLFALAVTIGFINCWQF